MPAVLDSCSAIGLNSPTLALALFIVLYCTSDVQMILELLPYDCCVSPFSRATFTVKLHRKSLYYVINLVIPCAVLSVIAMVTFILPPASGERVGIGQLAIHTTSQSSLLASISTVYNAIRYASIPVITLRTLYFIGTV